MKDANQEILEELAEIDYAFGTFYTHRIRAILETHTLEPIDDRPFDPTLCGFTLIYEGDKMKSWESSRHIVRNVDGCITLQAKAADTSVPWPATQSDGERLFKLLGVLR